MLSSVARRSPSLTATMRRHKPDYILLVLSVLLLVIGLVVVYAISPGLSIQRQVSENYYVSKQIIAIILGIVAFCGVVALPLNTWRRLETPLLISAAVASVAVRLFGEQVNGAYRWIQVGGFSFQAAELIKFALLIWLAGFLAERVRSGTLSDLHKTLKPIVLLLLVVGVVVAGLQSDLGSTAVMVAMVGAMLFVAGLPMKPVLLLGAVIGMGAVLAIASSSYRRDRLQTFLNPTRDCQDSGYQACQALIAVGSGGVFGLGLAHSVQAYGYLPEAANDSIFAIYAEKFGFLGSVGLIALFIALFSRMARVIERISDIYQRLLVTGVLAWLSTQAFINIGAMVGLLPLKGITLPFISYGGTSLIFVMAAIGLVFSVSRYTSIRAVSSQQGTATHDYTSSRRGERRAYYPTPSRRP